MARKRSSAVDDLLAIFAALPWWVGLAGAVVAWFGMGELAANMASGTRLHQILIGTVAGLARWGLPLICVRGSLMSLLARRKRAGLVAAASGGGAAAIAGMSWAEFEMLVGEFFRAQGYTVKETGGGSADGGIDLVARREGQTTLVQCKHWKVYTVGVPVVREMLGLMTAHGAAAGCVITSGGFTREAHQFAEGKAITLINGDALAGLLRQGKSALVSTAGKPATTAARGQEENVAPPAPGPACPSCGCAMVRRVATKGANAGRPFWGCSGFPACRSVRTMAD